MGHSKLEMNGTAEVAVEHGGIQPVYEFSPRVSTALGTKFQFFLFFVH